MNPNLWQNFRFTRFLAAMSISNIGDWLDIFALQIIFAHEFNASPIVMGILAFLYFIPTILLGPLAGVVVDRYGKRNIMIITDILSAGLTIALLLSHSILAALVLILVRSSIYSLNAPAQQAYIKQVVSSEHLLQASSYATISFQLSKFLGPLLGAVILIMVPARVCLGINAVSFISSFFILMTLPIDKSVWTHAVQNKVSAWVNDIKSGGVFVWHHAFLRMVIALTVVWFFCSMVRNSQLAIFLKHVLPFEPHALGYVLGLDGFGAVLAGTILSHRKSMTNFSIYFFSAFFLIAVGTLGIACYQAEWSQIFLYLAAFILGIGSGIGMIIYGYLLKKESPEKQIGFVYGASSAVQNLALAVGTLLSGFLVVQFGVREVYIALAFIMFFLAISVLVLLKTK